MKFLNTLKNIPLVALAVMLSLNACKKDPDKTDTNNTPTCIAGFGGAVALTVELHHHGVTIPSRADYKDSVYIKYNTQEFPAGGLNDFDTVIVGKYGGASHSDHIDINNLKCGKYYLFGAGYDSTINQRVYGGIPYEIKQDTGELEIIIPVIEGN